MWRGLCQLQHDMIDCIMLYVPVGLHIINTLHRWSAIITHCSFCTCSEEECRSPRLLFTSHLDFIRSNYLFLVLQMIRLSGFLQSVSSVLTHINHKPQDRLQTPVKHSTFQSAGTQSQQSPEKIHLAEAFSKESKISTKSWVMLCSCVQIHKACLTPKWHS